jgi:integrase
MTNGRVTQRQFPTRRAAVLFLEHLALTRAGVPYSSPAPMLSEAADAYQQRLHRLERSDATVRYYEGRIQAIIDVIGDAPLDRITQRDIDYFVTQRRKYAAATTVNKELSALHTIYKHAGVAPEWNGEPLSAQPGRRVVRPPDVVRKLWAELTGPAKVAVALCLFAGLRRSEAFAADASWVQGSELRVVVRKTAEHNRTHLVKTLRAILPKRGRLVAATEGQVCRAIATASKRAGIKPPYTGPGVFRHHCASYAADAGYSPEQIRLVLAHQTGTVTDRYIHSQSIKLKRKILEAVEKTVFTKAHH